ncbi:MAG: hypothetical protein E6Q88_06410 [Lysobacteraceae bacterium]|nr:MAG: hypothetical protein E6Q88_06410 [Xanthomonadaceae bacterium]
MRRRTHNAVLVLFLLTISIGPVMARAAPLHSADGADSVCPSAHSAEDADQTEPGSKPVAVKRGPASPAKSKPVAPYRGDGSDSVRNPRWHRFLPGMFR